MHDAIIREDIWDRVQSTLQRNSQKRRGHQLPTSSVAWLKGKLFDSTGDHLTPTHTRKIGQTIRYYISNRLLSKKDPTAYRLPAKVLEQSTCALIAKHLTVTANSGRLLNNPSVDQLTAIQVTASKALNPRNTNDTEALANFANVLKRGEVHTGKVILNLDPDC